jgi:hypothetical protein
MKYGFNQYEHSGMAWRQPAHVVSAIDLRPLPAQGRIGAPDGFAFAASEGPLQIVLAEGSDPREITTNSRMLDAWESTLGYRPKGATLADLLFDHLTAGADPTGDLTCPPLMPNRQTFEVLLNGRIKRQAFDHRSPAGNKMLDVRRRQYRKLRREHGESGHYRKVLGFWTRQYGIDNRAFQGSEPDERPLQPETTLTESFDTANNTTLGPDQTWIEYTQDFAGGASSVADRFQITSQQCRNQSASGLAQLARVQADLSSDDHYAQCEIENISSTNDQVGVVTRFETGGNNNNFYVHRAQQVNDMVNLTKSVNGTWTEIQNVAQTPAANGILRGSADGSTLKVLYDAAEKISETDTAITGNLRCGIFFYDPDGTAVCLDNFVASDLAASLGIPIAMRHYLRQMGVG